MWAPPLLLIGRCMSKHPLMVCLKQDTPQQWLHLLCFACSNQPMVLERFWDFGIWEPCNGWVSVEWRSWIMPEQPTFVLPSKRNAAVWNCMLIWHASRWSQPRVQGLGGFSRCRIFPMVVDREDVLKEHQKTAFGSSGNAVKVKVAQHILPETFFSVSELAECVPSANKLLRDFQQLANNGWMKVAYPPLEGYPCAVSLFWCFFPEKSSEKQRHSRAEGAIFFDPVVYASSQPFQTLLVSEAVVSRGWWVKSGSRRECFEFSSVWKQDLKNPGVVVTAAIRKGTVYHHCLQTGHYVTVKSGSKQPIWWWHGFQRSDDLQMGWSREMADDVLKRFKQCSVVRSVWRRFDTSTLLSWCEDVMD